MRERPLHHAAVGEHVAHARGHAKVIFEHHKLAVVQAQQIAAYDRNVDVARNLQSAHLPAIVLATVDQFARHYAIVQNLAVGVNIAQKQIQRGDPLRQTAFNPIPLLRRYQPRQQVIGKDALRTLIAAIHREGNALGQKCEVRRLLAPLQLTLRQVARFSAMAR